MPIAPPPCTYVCPICGHSQTLIPQSDRLVPGRDILTACPKCGNPKLQTRDPSPIEIFLAKLQAPRSPNL